MDHKRLFASFGAIATFGFQKSHIGLPMLESLPQLHLSVFIVLFGLF